MNRRIVHALAAFIIALLRAQLVRSGAAQEKPAEAFAQYPGWQHEGSLYILTTPEGADLPATASEENFPLLVRLDKNAFDFKQAQAKGGDLRFAAAGKALADQIEAWDAAAATANIWVRIPTIKGNAHQKIDMFWGQGDFNYDAAVDSNDLSKVLANYNQGPIVPSITALGLDAQAIQMLTAAGFTVVPEPSTLALLAAGLAALAGWMIRRRK